ncbi:hypothetical protein E4T47_02025 [Aureobasidium subglaciale]|nr:hypothetical protein E4T47_02025 [Aureobasidium subglaciale]
MSEDTRQLILRIQSEDLATLWASSENQSEVDATLRVYRRQLKLLDSHLENPRHHGLITDGPDTANSNGLLAIDDPNARLLTANGDVHQQGLVYPCHDTPSLFASAASNPSLVSATTARPHPKFDGPPRVRLPPPSSRTVPQSQIDPVGPFSRRLDVPSAPAAMRGVRLNAFVQSPPKRSADHLATPNASPSKRRATAIVKREVMDEPTLPSRHDTIKDKLQKLNSSISSRLQASGVSSFVDVSPRIILGVPMQISAAPTTISSYPVSRSQLPTGPKNSMPSIRNAHNFMSSQFGTGSRTESPTKSTADLNQTTALSRPASSLLDAAHTPHHVSGLIPRFGAPSELVYPFTTENGLRDARLENKSLVDDALPLLKPTTAKTKSAVPHQDCIVCGCREHTTLMYASPCGHFYCHSCINLRFESAIHDETLWPPRCCRQDWPDVSEFSDILQGNVWRCALSKVAEVKVPVQARLYCAGCSAWTPRELAFDHVHCKDLVLSHAFSARLSSTRVYAWLIILIWKYFASSPWEKAGRSVLNVTTSKLICPFIPAENTEPLTNLRCRCGHELCYRCGQEWTKIKGCSCQAFDGDWLQKREAERGYARIWKTRCNHENMDTMMYASDKGCDICGDVVSFFLYKCEDCLDRYCRECAWYRL